MLSSSVRAPSRKTTTSIVPTIELIAVRRRYSRQDRKSTRLNSSHSQISYAVFCLKKKKKNASSIAKVLLKEGFTLVAYVLDIEASALLTATTMSSLILYGVTDVLTDGLVKRSIR